MNAGPRSQRRATRRARARRRRRNVTLSLAGLLVAVAGAVSLGYGHGDHPDRAAAAGQGRTPAGGGAPETPGGSAGAGAPHEPAGTLTLAFAGDVHFTGRTAGRLDVHPALGPMAKQLAAADFSMVNLESAITTRGTPQAKIYHFRTGPAALTALHDSGVDAITMANNHAVDYGPVGLADSVAAKHSSPIPVIGIGADQAEAYRPFTETVNGVRLAVLAASQVYDLTNSDFRAGPSTPGIASALDRPRLLAAVRAAKAHADVVVVYLHWGIEGENCPVADQKSIAADLSAAGATAVVGTHAHVMLGSGMLGPTYVAYGFGNFLWYGTSPYPHSNDTGVTTLTVTRAGKVTGARFSPATVDSHGVPEPQAGAAGSDILHRYGQLRSCTGLTPPPHG
ncbi:poly-gamma-glutamate synthesis protein (capsule biosynthesis protein) [Actinacidiphila yanglinensis]|uniref:Poly-gamma-glutamate synthesis protein (Capsule biosynthesis protein) n=1 Tax=Actinacidiphila yanglinensis TaxID=310779 RepID=A0A1H5VKQ4_9ACTN|nr:CapA family protein [Actinacidiphila yanglinensis]SEF87849.1 poly-gamma-glutamate synthesis protein (capsule biosynthesis protein) [Actinacidiphila yanglinensis]